MIQMCSISVVASFSCEKMVREHQALGCAAHFYDGSLNRVIDVA
jgi:hypothetical protein